MSTAEIARELVALCQAMKFEEAYIALFAPDARSIEGTGETAEGLEAMQAKGKEWGESNEVHSCKVSGPFVGNDQFAVIFAIDITQKASGQRFTMEEVGVYKVQDGKITEELFLYGA